jgi:hypothetical protein
LTSTGFSRDKVYKVLNHKDGYLLLRNDKNEIKKVSHGYFSLLVKKDGSEEVEPTPTTPKQVSSSSIQQDFYKSKYFANITTGDKLKVVDSGDSGLFHNGDIVTYVKDTYEQDSTKMIDIVIDKSGKSSSGWKSSRFEIVPADTSIPDFKVKSKYYPNVETGDKLKIVNAEGSFMVLGDIVEYIKDSYADASNMDIDKYIDVKYQGKTHAGWRAERFKPIEKSASINANLKKGDKVKCIDDSGWGEGVITKGKIYEVIAYTADKYGDGTEDDTIHFVDDNGSKTSAYASRFVPYEGEEPSEEGTFKVGDKVKLKPDESYPDMTPGKIYSITNLPTEHDPEKLTALINDEGEVSVIYISRLEPAEDNSATKEPSGFAVGSKVKLKSGEVYPNVTKGKSYTVIESEHSNHDPSVITYIIADHGKPMVIYTYRFDQAKDRPSQIDAMAKTKDLTKPRFKVGDRVSYIGVDGKTFTGKISQVNSWSAMVNWDDGVVTHSIPLNTLNKIDTPEVRDIKI